MLFVLYISYLVVACVGGFSCLMLCLFIVLIREIGLLFVRFVCGVECFGVGLLVIVYLFIDFVILACGCCVLIVFAC